ACQVKSCLLRGSFAACNWACPVKHLPRLIFSNLTEVARHYSYVVDCEGVDVGNMEEITLLGKGDGG
ncbi:MAG: hypothetical protein V5B78_07765, partial [Desulfohalobiaceae bacterium]